MSTKPGMKPVQAANGRGASQAIESRGQDGRLHDVAQSAHRVLPVELVRTMSVRVYAVGVRGQDGRVRVV